MSMYDGIKKVTCPSRKQTAPTKTKTGETITGSSIQTDTWVEHYHKLFSSENTVTMEVLDTIENVPIVEELDNELTREEPSKAIDSRTNGKAPGNDAMPPHIIKHGKPAP